MDITVQGSDGGVGALRRQGDPGSTRYFLSLEDNLFRIFGGEKIKGMMAAFQVEDLPIESKMLTKSLDEAQRKVPSSTPHCDPESRFLGSLLWPYTLNPGTSPSAEPPSEPHSWRPVQGEHCCPWPRGWSRTCNCYYPVARKGTKHNSHPCWAHSNKSISNELAALPSRWSEHVVATGLQL